MHHLHPRRTSPSAAKKPSVNGTARYLLLVLPPSLLAGCYYPYGYGGYYGPYAPGYSQSYAPAYQPARSSYGGENCGTPDNFKPCPPLPRHPLP
jgi:hypothetical protein